MPFKIYNWNDIADQYHGGSLLLGNGASMAIDHRFGYKSLITHAQQHHLLTQDIYQLFDFFETHDFELVLRLVWQAYNVNRSLQIPDEITRAAYLNVRNCLIQAVRNIHPEHFEILEHLPIISSFMKNFRTVLSLNYDLILYWAMMYGNSIPDRHNFKDCFIFNGFRDDWQNLRTPLHPFTSTTLVFYPHGSLVLGRNKTESEYKLSENGGGLLESILDAWHSETVVPLFVSEGTSEQKINSIKSSNYLSTVYREVLKNLETNLVVYGWGFCPQDLYILKRIASSGIRRIAISVYGADQNYCARVHGIVTQFLGGDIQIHFFHSNSPNCWNN